MVINIDTMGMVIEGNLARESVLYVVVTADLNQTICYLRRIYTTFILSTALLNFGTRANNIGHGPLDFCRVKANFSEKFRRAETTSGGSLGPPKKRSACRNYEVFSSPESLRL